jgi:hypothetical protein
MSTFSSIFASSSCWSYFFSSISNHFSIRGLFHWSGKINPFDILHKCPLHVHNKYIGNSLTMAQ